MNRLVAGLQIQSVDALESSFPFHGFVGNPEKQDAAGLHGVGNGFPYSRLRGRDEPGCHGISAGINGLEFASESAHASAHERESKGKNERADWHPSFPLAPYVALTPRGRKKS